MADPRDGAPFWRHTIVQVAVVQAAVMVWYGPVGRLLLDADLPAWMPLTLDVAWVVAVTLMLFRAGRSWQIGGPATTKGLVQAALWIALATGYFVFRVRRWREPSALLGLDCLGMALVAISEELIWRGWILGALAQRYGRLKAGLASSALFGLAHAALLAYGASPGFVAFKVVWTSFLGMFFAGLLVLSRNYWVPIVAHWIVNCVASMAFITLSWSLRADWDLLVASPVLGLVGWHLCRGAGENGVRQPARE